MKWLFILLGAALPLVASDESARVTLPLTEFQKLTAAGKSPRVRLPVSYVLHTADYDVSVSRSFAVVQARWDLEIFDDEPLLVPLVSGVILESIRPDDVTLVHREGGLSFFAKSPGRRVMEARFRIPVETQHTGRIVSCFVPEAVLGRLTLRDSEAPGEPAVNQAVPLGDGQWQLGPGRELQIAIRPATSTVPVATAAVAMPPVVKQSQHRMRIVRDGTFLNASTWTVAHDEPLRLPLELGEKTEIVSCKVGGVPTAPLRRDDNTIEIPLSAPAGPSTIELTYTGAATPFAPVRGEFALQLPGVEFLVESVEWELTIPAPFEAVAVEGNCEFLPSEKRQEIRLRRELSRGDAARIRVFYQKPDTTKKP